MPRQPPVYPVYLSVFTTVPFPAVFPLEARSFIKKDSSAHIMKTLIQKTLYIGSHLRSRASVFTQIGLNQVHDVLCTLANYPLFIHLNPTSSCLLHATKLSTQIRNFCLFELKYIYLYI